jgi:hypothetical protein
MKYSIVAISTQLDFALRETMGKPGELIPRFTLEHNERWTPQAIRRDIYPGNQ